MSARAVTRASATVDPVTGVIVITLSIRPEGQIGQSLFQAIADDLEAGDPTPTFTITRGETEGANNGDIDMTISLATA